MADWKKRVKENEAIVLFWYKKMAEVGYGKLTVTFTKDNGKIDVRPELSIRSMEEQAVFKSL